MFSKSRQNLVLLCKKKMVNNISITNRITLKNQYGQKLFLIKRTSHLHVLLFNYIIKLTIDHYTFLLPLIYI
jgi:hypothetical protein